MGASLATNIILFHSALQFVIILLDSNSSHISKSTNHSNKIDKQECYLKTKTTNNDRPKIHGPLNLRLYCLLGWLIFLVRLAKARPIGSEALWRSQSVSPVFLPPAVLQLRSLLLLLNPALKFLAGPKGSGPVRELSPLLTYDGGNL